MDLFDDMIELPEGYESFVDVVRVEISGSYNIVPINVFGQHEIQSKLEHGIQDVYIDFVVDVHRGIFPLGSNIPVKFLGHNFRFYATSSREEYNYTIVSGRLAQSFN